MPLTGGHSTSLAWRSTQEGATVLVRFEASLLLPLVVVEEEEGEEEGMGPWVWDGAGWSKASLERWLPFFPCLLLDLVHKGGGWAAEEEGEGCSICTITISSSSNISSNISSSNSNSSTRNR